MCLVRGGARGLGVVEGGGALHGVTVLLVSTIGGGRKREEERIRELREIRTSDYEEKREERIGQRDCMIRTSSYAKICLPLAPPP